MKYSKIDYENLNAKQKEAYNFQKVSAVLSEFGFITVPMANDWNGADFLAIHNEGDVLKVQLKGRMTFDKKYLNKDLHICFREGNDWYLYPHDKLFELVKSESTIAESQSWLKDGSYHYPKLSEKHKSFLKDYKLVEAMESAA